VTFPDESALREKARDFVGTACRAALFTSARRTARSVLWVLWPPHYDEQGRRPLTRPVG